MKLSEFVNLPVIDCHVHFGNSGAGKAQLMRDEMRHDSEFITKVVSRGRLSRMYLTGQKAGLYLKAMHPRTFYSGGFAPWSGETNVLPSVDWPTYVAFLAEIGFDGIGEMGSKPVPTENHMPLDSQYYSGLWEACESLDFPVLCHVADPEEFWDERRAPEWAKKQGWVYYIGDYPTKEELYSEMENVLGAYPDLKVVLCHFYFISGDLEKASDFLTRYKNANLDLTLGIELMYNISRRRDDWRDFFIKHQDRIFFGTDIATWQTVQESIDRIWLIRNFLESDEEFFTPPTADKLLTRYEEPFIGLKLPEAALRRIYSGNFERLWGKEPRRVDVDLARKVFEEEGEKVIADAFGSLVANEKGKKR